MNLAVPTIQSAKGIGASGTVLPPAEKIGDSVPSGEVAVADGLGLAPAGQFSEVLEASASTLFRIVPNSQPSGDSSALSDPIGEQALLPESGSLNVEHMVGEILPEGGNALPPANADLESPVDTASIPDHIPVPKPLETATKQSASAPPTSQAPVSVNPAILPAAPSNQMTGPFTAAPIGAAKTAIAADAQGRPIPVTMPGGALASAAKAIGEPAKPATEKPIRPAITDILSGQNPLLAGALTSAAPNGDAGATQAIAAAPVASPSVPSGAASASVSTFGVALDGRAAAALEQSLEQIAQTREVGKATRPEILMRHAEFGLVSMRIDAAAGDMRATLSSRDPGFVPAVQAMLAERGVSASNDAASAGQRGSDGGQGQSAQSGQSQRDFGTAGSAAGSGQDNAHGQPSELNEQDEQDVAATDPRVGSDGAADTGARGLFA